MCPQHFDYVDGYFTVNFPECASETVLKVVSICCKLSALTVMTNSVVGFLNTQCIRAGDLLLLLLSCREGF